MTFYDAAGKVVKTIAYEHDVKSLDDTGEGAATFHIVEPFGCWNGDFAVVMRHDGRCEGGGGCNEVNPNASLEFYAADGKLLWTKKMLPIDGDFGLQVSKNDRRIWYKARTSTLVAISAEGKEDVFPLPKNSGLISRLGLSQNGRYAWAHAVKDGTSVYIGFYDLESGKTHDFLGEGNPEVSDDGLIKVWDDRNPPVRVIYKYQFK